MCTVPSTGCRVSVVLTFKHEQVSTLCGLYGYVNVNATHATTVLRHWLTGRSTTAHASRRTRHVHELQAHHGLPCIPMHPWPG